MYRLLYKDIILNSFKLNFVSIYILLSYVHVAYSCVMSASNKRILLLLF